MYLGLYRYDGDPDELMEAYDRLMEQMPPDALLFHACVRTASGIVVIDACPDEVTFDGFSTSEQVLAAMEQAGLPRPEVTKLGPVHAAVVRDGVRLV